MINNRYKLLLFIALLAGAGLACESFSAISRDYNKVRGTAESIATQADKVITQAKALATEFGDDEMVATAKAIATQQGPGLLATGGALATQAADEGYLSTVEALVTQGPRELLPTFQAVATQYLHTGGRCFHSRVRSKAFGVGCGHGTLGCTEQFGCVFV